jgi:hypothetical protein
LQADVFQHVLKKLAPVIDFAGLLPSSHRKNRRFSAALPLVKLGISVVQGILLDDSRDIKIKGLSFSRLFCSQASRLGTLSA